MADDRSRIENPEDDGRVIADMSGVERPSLFGGGLSSRGSGPMRPEPPRRPDPDFQMTRGEKFWMVLGGLKAGLAVSMVYVVFLGVVIALLLLLWM